MLDTQMPRNSQRDDEDFHKEPTIEQALIISQRKQLEQQAKSIEVLESAICVWSREELGAMPFEGDREAIEHFVSYWTNERFN